MLALMMNIRSPKVVVKLRPIVDSPSNDRSLLEAMDAVAVSQMSKHLVLMYRKRYEGAHQSRRWKIGAAFYAVFGALIAGWFALVIVFGPFISKESFEANISAISLIVTVMFIILLVLLWYNFLGSCKWKEVLCCNYRKEIPALIEEQIEALYSHVSYILVSIESLGAGHFVRVKGMNDSPEDYYIAHWQD